MIKTKILQGPSKLAIPKGDTHRRLICEDCGYIAYENPKIIAACVVIFEGRYLLCRRAIEPRRGFWTIPGGFLEEHETTAQGAQREAWEEATCVVTIESLVGLFEIPKVSQLYVVHKGYLKSPEFKPGQESIEVKLFSYQKIPWDSLAFSSVSWALQQVHSNAPVTGAIAAEPPLDIVE